MLAEILSGSLSCHLIIEESDDRMITTGFIYFFHLLRQKNLWTNAKLNVLSFMCVSTGGKGI